MKISSLIPEGRQNAMGRTELRERAMIKDSLMRSLIEEERRSGTVIINLQEVAKRLCVTRVTIWRWAKAKKIPAIKINQKEYRILESDLNEFIEQS